MHGASSTMALLLIGAWASFATLAGASSAASEQCSVKEELENAVQGTALLQVAKPNLKELREWTEDDAIAEDIAAHRRDRKPWPVEQKAMASKSHGDRKPWHQRARKRADNMDYATAKAKIQRKSISLKAVKEIMEADNAPLSEEGYYALASSRSNRKMERFIERVAIDLDLQLTDVGGLKGVVPYYSGQKDTQSFDALQRELLTTAADPEGWLTKKTRHENSLMQTGSTQTSATGAWATFRGGVSRVTQRVSRWVDILYHSRIAILMCSVGLLVGLFCLDDKKRVSKDMAFEDLLNMSPSPPGYSMKGEGHVMR
jgi:hypothetical protein